VCIKSRVEYLDFTHSLKVSDSIYTKGIQKARAVCV
jgi:hypothetical protein